MRQKIYHRLSHSDSAAYSLSRLIKTTSIGVADMSKLLARGTRLLNLRPR